MKAREKSNKICVLGAGLWGAVLANHLARAGNRVWVWEFFPEIARRLQRSRKHPHLPRLTFRPSVRFGSDMAAAVLEADTVLVALPSAHLRKAARRLKGLIPAKRRPLLVNASKGIEPGSLKTMGEVIEEEVPALRGRVYTVSGPSFAREVAAGVPTRLVLAGPRKPEARRLERLLDGGPIRVERSADRKGVELGGSLKNVVAIGCGLMDGLNTGANAKAAFMTQGLEEMERLIVSLGGRAETVRGLSGLGDLIATGTSLDSRNRGLGEKLGSGKGLKKAMGEIPTVMEGVESARSARALARSRGISCPLIEAVWRVLHRGAAPREVLSAMGF